LSPADLYSSILQGGRLNFIDLDRWCDPLVIQTLAERTHTPVDYVTQMGLSAYQGRVYERDDPNASLVWLPPIGGTKKKSFGQQACPLCLDQEKPYLRRTWRLSFVTACRTHGTHLIDRCESCGAPITPSKFKGAISFQGCVRCGSDLRRISVHTASETDLEIQRRLLDIASHGFGYLGTAGHVHSLAYFWILRRLFHLVVAGEYALPLRMHVLSKHDWDIAPSSIRRITVVDLLPPLQRTHAIRIADFLMSDWPHHFIEACDAVGLRKNRLIRDEKKTPFSFLRIVDDSLNHAMTKIAKDQVRAATAYMEKQGIDATPDALSAFMGNKLHTQRCLAPTKRKCLPYGTHRYWKLDGVSPETRAKVKKAAKLAGENVGSWVDRALREKLKVSAPTY
tara:strand:- start:161 stop:1345 length:1185 start_codon:yes stop_codon:yes gene_type:complete